MIISPDKKDFSTICHILGRLLLGLSFFMLIPLVVALLRAEISAIFDFTISFCFTTAVGFLLILFPLKKEISWVHAFFSVSLGWLLFSFFGSIPLYLSSHFISFLDAWFESMSGFTTTGLVLIQDLDHLSFAHNMWRHLTIFIGGQGIILAALSVLTRARPVAVGFYVGEARQEKIMPNVVSTARFIWKASFIYLILGIFILGSILYYQGMSLHRSFFHAMWLFFAAFDTGGFGPQAQNIAYYHSLILEIAVVVFMLLGAINFNLHFWVWHRSKKEIFKNFEMRTFFLTAGIALAILYVSLKGAGYMVLFRKGFFQLIAAHTTCGFTNLAVGELNQFSSLGILAIIFAMMVGGGVCSSSGGIKLIRLGIILRTFIIEVKRWMMPFKSLYVERIHHLQDISLSDRKIKEAYIFFTLFLFTYMFGAVVGMLLGYSPIFALFESVSATANVGLTVGITAPHMPVVLKLVYVFQMWAGRLEFLSIFVSLGFILSLFKK